MPKMKKQIKCKQVKFSLDDWAKVEQRAASVNMKTATYIQRMAVDGKILRLENKEMRNVILAMNRIGVSINQIARKANETHNIYSHDVQHLLYVFFVPLNKYLPLSKFHLITPRFL